MVKKGFKAQYLSSAIGKWISLDIIVQAESLTEAEDKLVRASETGEVYQQIRKINPEPGEFPLEIKFETGWCKMQFLAANIIE